jgi:hypothetical protein
VEWVEMLVGHLKDAVTSAHHRQLYLMRLNVLVIGKQFRGKKITAARLVNEELLTTLKNELCTERECYIQENPCFLMTGFSFVLM